MVEVFSEEKDGLARPGHDRLNVFRMVQRVLTMVPRGVVLLDDMDDAIHAPSFVRDGQEVAGRATIHDAMEQASMPSIWICNNPGVLSPALRRRFSLAVEIPAPPDKVRRRLVEAQLGDLVLGDSLRERLATDERMTPALVANVARVVRTVRRGDAGASEKDLDKVLEEHLRNAGGQRTPQPGADDGRHDLSLLNVDIHVPTVLERVKRHGSARIVFHGPPGTGKTALAAALARHVGKPLLLKRASDLLDKWVGQSEQNLAEMFAEARTRDAVLLLDEADSFLRARSDGAQRWELTQTNELLGQMEVFEGIFLCATNLLEVFDVAAMRRFDLKVRFSPLTPAGRWQAFQRSAAFLALAPLTDAASMEIRTQLERMGQLAIGDFRAAERRARLTDLTTPQALLSALKDEQVAKRVARPVGFGAHVEQ
jgi:SpoVK/Ycf46/Vps4 family AAA+-type ATPase